MGSIDLHCHSTASDGALAPEEVVARAAQNGVSVLALTDHDSIAGLPAASAAAIEVNITLVPGVEMSAVWRGYTIHILGYDFDPDDAAIRALVSSQSDRRHERASRIAQRLAKASLGEHLATATAFAGGEVPGRPHFARSLVEAGKVKDFNQAFDWYLGAGKIGDVQDFWPEVAEVTRELVRCGAVAVLAHPRHYKMTATKLRELLAEFREAGGKGIEVISPGNDSGDIGLLAEYCQRFGMYASQGSDFHAAGNHWTDLGRMAAMPEGLQPVWSLFRESPVS